MPASPRADPEPVSSLPSLFLRPKNTRLEVCLCIPTGAGSETVSSLRALATDLGCPSADEGDLDIHSSVNIFQPDDSSDVFQPGLRSLRETLLEFLRSTNRDACPSHLQTLGSMVDVTIQGWVGQAIKIADDLMPKTPSLTGAAEVLRLAQSIKAEGFKLDILSTSARMYDDLRESQDHWSVPRFDNSAALARLKSLKQILLPRMKVEFETLTSIDRPLHLLKLPLRRISRTVEAIAALSSDDAESIAMQMLSGAQEAHELNTRALELLDVAQPDSPSTKSKSRQGWAKGSQDPLTLLTDGYNLHQTDSGCHLCIEDSDAERKEKWKSLSRAMKVPLSSSFKGQVIRPSDVGLEEDPDVRTSCAFRTAWSKLAEKARMALVSASLTQGAGDQHGSSTRIEQSVELVATLGLYTGAQMFQSMCQQARCFENMEFPKISNDATNTLHELFLRRIISVQVRQGGVCLEILSSALDLYEKADPANPGSHERLASKVQKARENVRKHEEWLSTDTQKGEVEQSCERWLVSFEDLSRRTLQELYDIAKITSRQEHNLDQAWERLSRLASAPEKIQEALQKLEKRKRRRRPKHNQKIEVNSANEISQDGVAPNSWDPAHGADSRHNVLSREEVSDHHNDPVE